MRAIIRIVRLGKLFRIGRRWVGGRHQVGELYNQPRARSRPARNVHNSLFFFFFFLPFAVNPVEAPGNIQSGPPAKIQSSVYFCTNIHRGAQFQYQPEYYIFVGRFCCVDIVFFFPPLPIFPFTILYSSC